MGLTVGTFVAAGILAVHTYYPVLPWRPAAEASAGGLDWAIVLSAGWTAGVRLALLGGNSCVRSRRGRLAFQRGSELLRARRTDTG